MIPVSQKTIKQRWPARAKAAQIKKNQEKETTAYGTNTSIMIMIPISYKIVNPILSQLK